MDEVDIALCRNLLKNSRTPYSELSKALGLTPQAVHRRVQTLTDAGIIGGTYSFPSIRAFGQMWVMIFGWSRSPSMDEVAAKLRTNRMVAMFQVASGNFVYVHGSVRDATELAHFVSYVQKEAFLNDAQVGILPTPPAADKGALSQLDLRLISALKNDSRRAVADVASEVGVSAKTVRKRIERLVKDDLVSFSIHWQPDTQGDTITNIHLSMSESVEKERVAFLLIKKLAAGVVRTYSFSNLPNQMIVLFWTKNVREMQQTCRELEAEGLFCSVVPNIIRDIHYYDEHRSKLLEDMLKRS